LVSATDTLRINSYGGGPTRAAQIQARCSTRRITNLIEFSFATVEEESVAAVQRIPSLNSVLLNNRFFLLRIRDWLNDSEGGEGVLRFAKQSAICWKALPHRSYDLSSASSGSRLEAMWFNVLESRSPRQTLACSSESVASRLIIARLTSKRPSALASSLRFQIE
jgi:hypothetical protein